MTITIEQQIAAAARELAMRRNVYKKWVASGRMTEKTADHEIAAMEAIVETLQQQRTKPVTELIEREQTYGEKAVGLSFNPSGDAGVDMCKTAYAGLIDQMDRLRATSVDLEVKRLAAAAITHAQTAQMWAVKALTYRG